MRIYNTLTNKIENFTPIEEGKIKLYVCGPTVYNYIHIGNARPIIVFDVLARYFKYKNYDVKYVQNFTDVDDKIIKKANEENVSSDEITKKYIQAFFDDISTLNILEDIIRPKVTENINEIIEIIENLIKKGFAYEKDGDVYFEVKKYEEYGKLSNQKIEELELGARVEISEIKKNPLDFALWKKKKDGEPFWKSPWGDGRPGWHIECSAMSKKYLGDNFDIHGGGQDLIFPHHENEIAQSCCSSGKKFANYWMHNGFIQIDGNKMSKSLGNFFLLREVLEKFSGNVIRLFMISTHYRKPINFSFEDINNTKKALQNINNSLKRFETFINKFPKFENKILENNNFYNKITTFKEKFDSAMEEDMNTPQALSIIFEQIKETNKFLDENENTINKKTELEKEEIIINISNSLASLKNRLENILGIKILSEEKIDEGLSKNLIEFLLELRNEARKEKNFTLSDKIRDKLKEFEIIIKDNKDGTTSFEI